MPQTVLLTGGAGYIGSHTYVALAEAGYRPVILDSFVNARDDVPERLARLTGAPVSCHRADIRDATALHRVFAAERIDAVIHFAALKSVGESVARPLDYTETNIGGLMTLLRVMGEAGLHRLVFSSSATVYGAPQTLPIPETAPVGHTNPYGFTKLTCEQILQQLAASDPRWCFGILRYFNPAGAHHSALLGEDPRDTPNNLMPYLARVATGELPALQVFGDDYDTPDGTGLRDYIHVEDLARGHVLSLGALLEQGAGHLVNLGTGQGYSVLEVLRAYSRACGRDLPHVIAPRRPGDVAACYADPSRAADFLGFRACRTLDEMCASSWAWISAART
ncbi:UDP-glucose 4-epimerase GalE [Alkalilacustris brevis]|uniref:UDP-glucose 4-epimerase GalE n=1 Tax=Alkalilacustris brevis TaxID=2026338 RepID=UPI000E0D0BE2|nr:UDP-glucose 4-epimerase GalE [Alkalilacustris brevis]